ncbi:hypothetical protein NL676_034936 [Syzygium grande]|nr:hypothetical protein NL676_034936 [Syzygium grande]
MKVTRTGLAGATAPPLAAWRRHHAMASPEGIVVAVMASDRGWSLAAAAAAAAAMRETGRRSEAEGRKKRRGGGAEIPVVLALDWAEFWPSEEESNPLEVPGSDTG